MALFNDDGTITVEAGDTLGSIANALNISLSDLLAENPGITDPDLVNIGQVLQQPLVEDSELPEDGGLTPDGLPQDDGGTPVDGEEREDKERFEERPEGTGGGGSGGTGDKSPATDPQGAGENIPGILNGGTVVKVRRDDQDDLWFMQYEYPPGSGQFVLFQFDSLDQVKATLGKDFATSGDFSVSARPEKFIQLDTVDIVGSAAELAGMSGNFTGFIEDLQFQAALDAGIRDPGLIGKYLSDPDVQRILALGALGDWTPERIQAEIRGTTFYQDVLYPGIKHFLDLGSANPEGEWKQYVNTVSGALDLLGIERDPDGSFRSAVGDLLSGGVDDQQFVAMAPTLFKAQNSPEFAETLNAWMQRDLGRELTFDELFDVFNGTSSGELNQVVEQANLEFAAQQQGVEVARGRLARIAANTDLTEAQAQAAFSTVEQQLLALDQVILEGRFGLTQGELVDAATGIAPKSGRSIQEVRNLARKAAIEESLLDNQKQQLFVGFNPRTGTPFRPGLNPLSTEGA
jgi:LysM repeat protein